MNETPFYIQLMVLSKETTIINVELNMKDNIFSGMMNGLYEYPSPLFPYLHKTFKRFQYVKPN